MGNSTYGPKLIVNTQTALALSRQQVYRKLYRGDDGNDYIICMANKTGADTDSIYAITGSKGTTVATFAYTEAFTGLTKYKRYTFAIHNKRVYITNGTDPVFWIYCNSAGTWSSGYLNNCPFAEFIIEGKSRLWLGGETTTRYQTGTATLTQNSYAVTGTGTEWSENARAGDQIGLATLYTTGTAIFTPNSTAVVGASTVWSTNVSSGDMIQLDADAVYYRVSEVTDDTHLVLEKEYEDTGNVGATAAYTAASDPTVWYTIRDITSDTALNLTDHYVAATATTDPYVLKRIANDVIYWSAEQCLNDFTVTGVVGGGDNGILQMHKRNLGIHNFDDAILFFHEDGGDFIFGTDESTWTIPKSTKIPVKCISHDSIVSHEGWLGFLSDKGYYVTKGSSLSFSDLGAEPYSEMITTLFTDIDKEVAAQAQSFVYKDSLYVSVPAESIFSDTDSELSYSTGTVSVTDATTAVTGSGTSWRGTVYPDDLIRFGTDVDSNGDPLYYKISAVTSDTALTILTNKDTTVTGGSYVIRKRRNNRVIVLDTRTHLKKRNHGWTVYDNINPDGFILYDNSLLYGSSTTGSLYQYDTGGLLYDGAITATAKTKRMDCGQHGVRKFFKAFKLKAKGTGVVYVTPYVDGVAGTRVSYTFSSSTQYEEVYFPRPDNSFSGIGYEIQYLIECTGSNEDIIVYPIKTGFITMQRK